MTCQQEGSWKEGIKARMKGCRQTKVENSWGVGVGGAVWQATGTDLKVTFIISHIPPHSSTLWLYCRQGGTEGEALRWGARGEGLLLQDGQKHRESDTIIEKSLRGLKDIHIVNRILINNHRIETATASLYWKIILWVDSHHVRNFSSVTTLTSSIMLLEW